MSINRDKDCVTFTKDHFIELINMAVGYGIALEKEVEKDPTTDEALAVSKYLDRVKKKTEEN